MPLSSIYELPNSLGDGLDCNRPRAREASREASRPSKRVPLNYNEKRLWPSLLADEWHVRALLFLIDPSGCCVVRDECTSPSLTAS